MSGLYRLAHGLAVSPVAIAAGLAVGILWIATDPMANTRGSLQPWLGSLPWWLALAWIALRALNTVVLVPIAEELAFRGSSIGLLPHAVSMEVPLPARLVGALHIIAPVWRHASKMDRRRLVWRGVLPPRLP